jgi:hypothetical protein
VSTASPSTDRVVDDVVDAIAVSTTGTERGPYAELSLATFYSYLGRDALAQEALDRGLRMLGERGASHRLVGGLAGLGWLLDHLLGEAAAEPCAAIDAHLLELVAAEPWPHEHELLRGLAGVAVYALARAHVPLAERVLHHLERAAVETDAGVYWPTGGERIDLGLSHGLAGILAVLARYVAAGIEPARARPLIERGVAFLLSTPRPPVGRFTDLVVPGARDVKTSRLAWCYGDAGACLALAAAARACARDDWHAETLAIARAMAERPFDTTLVADTPLCHGTAGIAHTFRCLARLYDDAPLHAAADRWIAKTLELRRPGEGYGGFQFSELADTGQTWGDSPTLLIGAPGVALVLHAEGGGDHAWDAKFLFDVDRLPSAS